MEPRQIGWSQESILLWGISKELERLAGLIASFSGGGGGGGGTTNLSYTASPTNGIVNSSTGTGAPIPLVTAINAGLMSPGDFTKLASLNNVTADNGLTKTLNNIRLGGNLLIDTFIDGAFALRIGTNTQLSTFNVQAGTPGNTGLILANATGVTLQGIIGSARRGEITLSTTGTDIGGYNGPTTLTLLRLGVDTLGSTTFTDNRTGANRSGIEYSTDISANFRPLSLINKAYADAAYATTSTSQTFTNKGIVKRTETIAGATTSYTLNCDSFDVGQVDSGGFFNTPIVFNTPSGTPTANQLIMYHVRDSGTARTLNFSTSGIFMSTFDFVIPTTTIAGKWMKILFMWNSVLLKWECVSIINSN